MPGHNEDNVFFIGDFDDSLESCTIVPLIQEIKNQRRRRDGKIDLHINSFGGYAHLVMNLVELVEIAKREGIIVRTIVPSVAFSAGSMLAVSGSPGERYISKTGEHLVHYGSTGSVETTPTQIERYRAWKDRDFKNTIKHYQRYCTIPNLEEQLKDDGFFVPARDCIKWGLADKYTDKLEL